MKIKNWLVSAAALLSALPAHAMHDGCMEGPHGGMAMIPLVLLGMAVGYWVLTLAAKQNRVNSIVGKLVGWIILLVSLSGLLCAGLCRWRMCSSDSMCGGMAKPGCHGMMSEPEAGPEK